MAIVIHIHVYMKLHSCMTLIILTHACDDQTLCMLCLCRDFDLQLRPDTDLFHPDFTLKSGERTVRKHGMKSYFYSGFDRSELDAATCNFVLYVSNRNKQLPHPSTHHPRCFVSFCPLCFVYPYFGC